jgi:hypothetical protein
MWNWRRSRLLAHACLERLFSERKCLQPATLPFVQNRTEPKTFSQWVRYLVVAAIAIFLVWWMLRLYVL